MGASHMRRALRGKMRVGRQHVDETAVQKLDCGFLRVVSQPSENASFIDLNDEALLKPALDDVKMLLNIIIPLRVRDYRCDALPRYEVKHPVNIINGLVKHKLRK